MTLEMPEMIAAYKITDLTNDSYARSVVSIFWTIFQIRLAYGGVLGLAGSQEI